MPPVLFVPLGNRRVLVHLLDDVAPTYPRVIGAETDLALLRAVRDDAHLRAAEVVVEQVLEPHAGDEEEIPAVVAAGLEALLGAVPLVLAVGLTGQAERLVELLEQLVEREVRWRLVRVVVLE